jgi:hypothetical protein
LSLTLLEARDGRAVPNCVVHCQQSAGRRYDERTSTKVSFRSMPSLSRSSSLRLSLEVAMADQSRIERRDEMMVVRSRRRRRSFQSQSKARSSQLRLLRQQKTMTGVGQSDNKVEVVLGAQWGDEGKGVSLRLLSESKLRPREGHSFPWRALGKLVDIIASQIDICARCAGGNNAGHTIVADMENGRREKFDFHLLPSGECHILSLSEWDRVTERAWWDATGLVNPNCVAFVGSGVVVHLPSFFAELDNLQKKGTCHRAQHGPHISTYTDPAQASNATTGCSSRTGLTSSSTFTRSLMA